jgi:hypothetical protein
MADSSQTVFRMNVANSLDFVRKLPFLQRTLSGDAGSHKVHLEIRFTMSLATPPMEPARSIAKGPRLVCLPDS